jgi:uncharacterized repeat protein (TIGR02543 family)
MKRRLLVSLFISVILLSALSIAVIADGVTDWTSNNSLPSETGSYVLKNDVNLSSTWYVTEDIVLDLGGHNIILTGSNGIEIQSHSLTLKGSGTISFTSERDSNKYFIKITANGMLNLNGPTLTSSIKTCLKGGGVWVESGTFNMTSGEITGCRAISNSDGFGGGVYVAPNAVFNMSGGRIWGNNSVNGGGAFFDTGSHVNLSGGEITGNTATRRGGGVNSLHNSSNPLLLSSGIRITGNTVNTSDNNLDIDSPTSAIEIEGILTGQIGITSTGAGVVSGSSTADKYTITPVSSTVDYTSSSSIFASDNPTNFVIGTKEGKIVLGRTRTITFNANNGTDAATTASAAHGSDYTTPACTFTKAGYRFTAWNTASDGTGTPYVSGSTIEVEGSNVTLYAQWVEAVPEFSGHSVTLTGDVGLNFLMILPEGLDYSGSYMEFTLQGSTSRVYTTEAVHESSGKYRFTCYVSSIQMAEKVTPAFHYDSKSVDGTAFSVKDYIDYAKQHSSEAEYAGVIDIVNALDDYGYYAQIRLSAIRGWRIGTDYKEMTGDFTEFTEGQKSDVTSAVSDKGLSKNIKDTTLVDKITYSMDFLSSPLIYIYVKPVSVISDIKAYEVTGETKALAVETMPDGRYRVIISAGMIYNVETTHNISIKSGDTEVATVDVSGFSYVRAAMGSGTLDEINFMTAFYRFYAATKNYVTTHTGS